MYGIDVYMRLFVRIRMCMRVVMRNRHMGVMIMCIIGMMCMRVVIVSVTVIVIVIVIGNVFVCEIVIVIVCCS